MRVDMESANRSELTILARNILYVQPSSLAAALADVWRANDAMF